MRRGLTELLADLDDEEWRRPTVCTGWDVKDVALHLLGVEIANVSRRRDGVTVGPAAGDDLAAWLNHQNEAWVRAARGIGNRLLIDLLDVTGSAFETCLAEVDLDGVAAHVTWAGTDPVPAWLDIAREYTERWVHQQQIRDACRRAGLDGPDFLGPVLRTFVHALPRTYVHVEAPAGTAVELRVTGPGGGAWHVTRSESGWEPVAGPHRAPDARVTLHGDAAWRLFTRNPLGSPPVIEGDVALGGVMRNAVAIVA